MRLDTAQRPARPHTTIGRRQQVLMKRHEVLFLAEFANAVALRTCSRTPLSESHATKTFAHTSRSAGCPPASGAIDRLLSEVCQDFGMNLCDYSGLTASPVTCMIGADALSLGATRCLFPVEITQSSKNRQNRHRNLESPQARWYSGPRGEAPLFCDLYRNCSCEKIVSQSENPG
jgi:hypothetical protein